MIVLTILVYYLSTALAAPVPAPQTLAAPDSTNTRTLRDIVVSCLTTIFACTWVSMHPNVPALEPEDQSFWEETKSGFKRFYRRGFVAFAVALLFPEYIVGWALRQRLTAGNLVKVINEHTDGKKIKMAHAFFIIMGGVHKRTENGSYPLDRYQVASLLGVNVEKKEVDDKWVDQARAEEIQSGFLLPPAGELRDKSKSDSLAKLLVLVQILWFIIQCIARGIQHLPITELEVITLAYAVLNFAIYIAWWDKPSRVDYPVLIDTDVGPEIKDVVPESRRSKSYFVALAVASLIGEQDREVHLNTLSEAPNFYSGDPLNLHIYRGSFISFLLGTAFGAVHCVNWYSTFPDSTEQKLWRISSLLLTGASFAGVLAMLPFVFTASGVWWKAIPLLIAFVISFTIIFLSPLILLGHVAARVATVYVAFHSLSSLPSKAFIAVQWTNLIPHL